MRPDLLRLLMVSSTLAATCLAAPAMAAQSCRAQQIMASQCTWFALEELGGAKAEAAKAQREATATLIDGCSSGEYQMVLLRGTGLSDAVLQRMRASGTRTVASVRRECAAEASRMASR
jgi:hypothetical protein